MRIALCFSGQPRTWEKCYPTWEKLARGLKKKFKAERVDIFCHAWNFNTVPNVVLADKIPREGQPADLPNYLDVVGVPLTAEEKKLFSNTINPRKLVFETEKSSKRKPAFVMEQAQNTQEEHGAPVLEWAASQFYSIMAAAHIKKMYEFDNGFRYDMCFRMRYDLYFDDHQVGWFLSDESGDAVVPESNSIYTCHTRLDNSAFPFRRFGDIFWYADSPTFDKICNFYRWLPMLGKRGFVYGDGESVTPEHGLAFYAKMFKMNIVPISVDPKIYRQEDYLEQKLRAGLPAELGGHELI